jgi:hypothetical protein
MFPPSDFLCVDHVILSVRFNEADVNDPIGIVDPHHQPVLVARNIEHRAAILEDRPFSRPPASPQALRERHEEIGDAFHHAASCSQS